MLSAAVAAVLLALCAALGVQGRYLGLVFSVSSLMPGILVSSGSCA